MSSDALPNNATIHGNSPDNQYPQGDPWRNDLNRGLVVQKFGGTSLGKVPVEIVEGIVKQALQQHHVAVVCSARSSDTKAKGTTNRQALPDSVPNSIDAAQITSSRQ